mmetsp:Transcript_23388/g.44612  ORF Transcript_23388/g.44612 Transcript_23388/m.44612 type:complete len:583 (-) Transcript_23388:555-2303(-)|eukprot:CAMPEP_0114258106 /NCGR_PEP_ID=MMETSP0058-20121206/19120_1 /TAXON_ID=36894 /ORGANISM="Pyramimonas parkeae, CCMP726" /LENGTH=582 /DNA_ID=CAMNT_0001372939 /DNA_START=98 /DNA_END=1846 /DNA_ORIENTATION=+
MVNLGQIGSILQLGIVAICVRHDFAWADESEKETRTTFTDCSGFPHRDRYKCYADQLVEDVRGTRSRGRMLNDGLPPIFDIDFFTDDNGADPGSSKAGTRDTASGEKGAMGAQAAKEDVEKDWIIVWDESQVSSSDISRVCGAGLSASNKTCQREFSTAITGFSAHLSMAELESVLSQHSSQIKYAERDQDMGALMASQTTNLSWSLDRIDSASGLSGSYDYVHTGKGVHIYVLDTGVRITHEQFGYLNGSAGSRAQSEYDFIDNDYVADDCEGHGTYVAAFAAGKDYGVAKDSQIHSLRVMDCTGRGTLQNLLAALDWVEANHISPAVTTLCLGGGASVSFDEAVAALVAAGVTVTAAAGNDAEDACMTSPSRERTAITVGATDEYDAAANFTNFGPCVNLFAPGTNALGANNRSDTSTVSLSGTSVGTSYVSGVAALYLESSPAATPAEVMAALVNFATKDVITGLDVSSPNKLLYSMSYLATSAPTSTSAAPTAAPTTEDITGLDKSSNNVFSAMSYLASSAPTSTSAAPTTSPAKPAESREQPLKDNWFRKRAEARKAAFPQKHSWFKKEAKRQAGMS